MVVDQSAQQVNGGSDPNYSVLDSADPNECGVVIAASAQEHLGQWECLLNEGQTPSITGVFQLLEAVEDSFLKEGIRWEILISVYIDLTLLGKLTYIYYYVYYVCQYKRANVFRLPRHLVPSHYDISLIPIFEDPYVAYGHTDIDLTYDSGADTGADDYTQTVVLHAKNLNFDLDTLTVLDTAPDGVITAMDVVGFEFDYEREFFKIILGTAFSDGGSYTVSTNYTSNLNVGDLRGFYTSTYEDEASGQEETLAVTQFEAVDARRAFPCLDEPDLKAIFKVSLGRPLSMMAASNMPIESTDLIGDMDGFVMEHFVESKIMSTYLVALFVGDYDVKTTNMSDRWEVSVLHQPSQADQIGLALESGAIMLAGYEDYFDILYPLPKLDMVAIPDFYYGGMENWGLITYAEIYLSLVEGDSSTFDEASVVEVVAHEIAHQWFGDLVTMKWWEDLWLNEGRFFKG